MSSLILPGDNQLNKTLAGKFNKIRADYDMSRESRFVRRRTGLAPSGGSADYHYRNEGDYYHDIEKARDMDRNDAVVGQTVDRAVANIVQGGFSLDPKTGDKRLDADLQARWRAWANSADEVDIAGEFTFRDIEAHSMRSMLLDGDVVVLGLQDGAVQMIEAHNVQTKTRVDNTVLGVTKNRYGKRERYWVMQDPIESWSLSHEPATPVNVRDENGLRQLFHVYNPKRVTQTRGVTAFAPIFAITGMFEDINFAKVVQQQVVSCFAVFRSRVAQPDLPSVTPSYGRSEIEATAAGTRYIEGISPGMEIVGAPGEQLEGFSPNVPNAEFFDHVKLMLTLIGVNLGLPLTLVLMDGSQTNFSGWRGAVDEARKGFKANQQNLIRRLHEPLYRWKVAQWLSDDRALRNAAETGRRDVFAHKWNAPAWQYIEPLKDAQGDAFQLQSALTSPRRKHAERNGEEWEVIRREIIEDNASAIIDAKKRAMRINSQFDDGQPVHWRDLIPLPMPTGVQMTMQDPNAIEAQQQQTDDEPQQEESVEDA